MRVQTNKGCDTTFNFMQVFQNPAYSTNHASVKESCDGLRDGELHITVTGTTNPYQYNFRGGLSMIHLVKLWETPQMLKWK